MNQDKTKSKIFRNKLQSVHVSFGITFSLFMYIAIFFGIFAIYLPFIQVWEKPSRHFAYADVTKIDYSAMIEPVILDPDFPKNDIIIKLPDHDPALAITHRFTKAIMFNPNTNERINQEDTQSNLAKFLNGMHYGRPLGVVGRFLFGFVAVAVLFLIIGGLIQVSLIRYGNIGKNQQNFFSKWHRKILTWVFAPFIIITLTGALMNVGLLGAGPMASILTKGKISDIDTAVGPTLFPKPPLVKNQKEEATMLPIASLIQKARKINPNINFKEIRLINWKDKSAQVEFKGYNPYMPFLNGIFNKPTVTLSAVDGSLVRQEKVMDKSWSALVADSTFFLHFLFGVDIITRTFISLLMLSSTVAIGFGVMLWLEKKAKKFDGKISFYHWFGKLSLAVMVGVIPATALLFVLQWILPIDMKDRVLWQEGIFFTFWLGTLTWSFYRINSYKAVKEFFTLGGILFIISPLLHFYFSGFSPFKLFENSMYVILNVDIALFIFGALLLFLVYKLPNTRNEAKLFFIKK